MKIGILITDVTYAGGTEKITQTLSDVFHKNGHSVSIITCHKANKKCAFEFSPNVKIIDIRDQEARKCRLNRIADYLRTIRKVKSIIKKNSFDILICQSFAMSLIGYFASIGTSTKVISCEHTSYDYYLPWIRRATIELYKRTKALVVINQTDASKYKEFLDNVFYIPNIVELNPTISQQQLYPRHQNHRLVSVGRIEHHKGFDRLIKAMKIVVKRYPKIELSIYGYGSEFNNIKELISNFNLENNIELKGVSTNLDEIYKDKTIFILPSRIEGFGLVLIEAANYGLPLISFDCPNGPRDILKNNRGILVPDGDIEALGNSIIELINYNLWEVYHKKSLELVEDYRESSIYPQWNQLFKRVNS